MKIILLDNVKSLGNKGEIKEVSEGYARNFLLPKKLAEIATEGAIEALKKNQDALKIKERQEDEMLRKKASTIQGRVIKIKAKSEKGKLFGSIGTREICLELKKQGFEIKEKSITLKGIIKNTGEKEIFIDFGKNIKAKITVSIEKA